MQQKCLKKEIFNLNKLIKMKRREMLKGLGLSIGALTVSPYITGILQSCTDRENLLWKPAFFTENQVFLLNKVVNIILPETPDSPSATQVNVPQFIDKYVFEVIKPKDQKLFKKGISSFGNLFMKDNKKVDFRDVKDTDIENKISKILNKSKKEHKEIMKNFNDSVKSKSTIEADVINYVFIDSVRELSIFAYKSSEYVAEKVLAYYPVPGKQQGCIDLQKATNGKAYSL